jgi:poly(hydroxyalkanoate) depolymerase family esterase
MHDTVNGPLPAALMQSGRFPASLLAGLTSFQDPGGLLGAVRSSYGRRAGLVESPPAGRFIECSYSGTAGARTYKLYVPSGCVGQSVPLVVMLHGCMQDPDQSAAGTRLNALAEESTFLVAYPEQNTASNPSKCWNWFLPTHQRRGEGEPAIIAGITQHVMTLQQVDERHVYLAGMSAGGAMAAITAAAYPELYAAVAVHSGVPAGAAHDVRTAFVAMRQGARRGRRPADPSERSFVPTIVFHGYSDTTVNPGNAQRVLEELGLPGDTTASSSSGHVPRGRAFTRFIYRRASGDVVAECWLIHGAGHAWSGGSPAGSFTDPLGPDATREMIRFFHEHPRMHEIS